jgi:hypothetical protein
MAGAPDGGDRLMGLSIDEILSKAQPRVEHTRVCLDGELLGEHSRLSDELDELQRAAGPAKLGGNPEALALAEKIQAVEAKIEKAKVPFKFKGIGSQEFAAIMARFPSSGPQGWNVQMGAPALIAACAIDPSMTEEQATQLCAQIAGGATQLFEAAWRATNEATNTPPSVRASALISGSGSK